MNQANQKKCLLIGNGLNRIDNNSIKWNDLILSPVEPFRDKGFVDIPKMSYPLKFEYIINYLNENSEEEKNTESIYQRVKNQIIEKLNAETYDKMLNLEIRKLLREIEPDSFITINYDIQLEKSILQ